MIEAFCIILGCELSGEVLRRLTDLPVPGPVIGMLILATGLIVWPRLQRSGHDAEPAIRRNLERLANALLENMGLLFVPAGVGVIAEADLIRQEWLPILAGVLGSTLIGLVVTAVTLRWTLASSKATPSDSLVTGAPQ